MAISATRFKFLDQQTNVPVANLATQNSSDLLNSGLNDLPVTSPGLTGTLNTSMLGGISSSLLPGVNTSSIGSEISSAVSSANSAVSGISSGVLSAVSSEISSASSAIGSYASSGSTAVSSAISGANTALNSAGNIPTSSSSSGVNAGSISGASTFFGGTTGVNSGAIGSVVSTINPNTSSEISLITGPVVGTGSSLSSSINSLSSGIIPGITGVASSLTALGSVRLTNDPFSSFLDTSSANPAAITTALSGISSTLGISGSNISNGIKSLTGTCRNSLLGNLASMSQLPNTNSCPGGGSNSGYPSGSCDPASILTVLSGATGGLYAPSIYNSGNLANALAQLSNSGYGAGLCGVYSALTANVSSPTVLSKVLGNVLGTSISTGNMTSAIDVLGTLRSGSATAVIPGLVGSLWSSYNSPSNTPNSGLAEYSSSFINSISNGLPNWFNSSTGNLSTSDMGGATASNSSSINSLLLANSASQSVDPTVNPSTATIPNSSYQIAGNSVANTDISVSSLFSFL